MNLPFLVRVLLCVLVTSLPGAALAEPSGPAAESQGVRVNAALGKGVEFITTDDAFRLNIRGRMQLRGSLLSEEPGDAPELVEFQARRVRLVVQGHIFQREWEYYLQLAFSNLDTEPDLRSPVRDAYMTWTGLRDLHVRVGQMKVPFSRQRVVSSSALQLVDRSLVSSELNLDRDVGIQAFSTDLFGLGERLGYNLGLFHGDGRNRLATAPGVLVVGRLAFRPFGGFDDFVESDFNRTPDPRLAVGVAAAHNENTQRPRSTFSTPYGSARFSYDHLTADLMFKWRGLSLLSEVSYRKADRPFEVDPEEGEVEFSRSAWGWYAQGGYMLTRQLEVAGRIGVLYPLGDTDPDLRRERELGGGLSWYASKHDFKVQGDYFHLEQEGGAGEHQVRVQLQLYF